MGSNGCSFGFEKRTGNGNFSSESMIIFGVRMNLVRPVVLASHASACARARSRQVSPKAVSAFPSMCTIRFGYGLLKWLFRYNGCRERQRRWRRRRWRRSNYCSGGIAPAELESHSSRQCTLCQATHSADCTLRDPCRHCKLGWNIVACFQRDRALAQKPN